MKFFTVLKEDETSCARVGRIVTGHGEILTPAFMPVGTQGTVKAVQPKELLQIGYQILLSNTYHLYLRPGEEILQHYAGLHNFMCWQGAILTDSGGFQVFSLSKLRTITDDGVQFQSHIDGSRHFLTPEKVIDIQRSIGSDIMMVLDECPPHTYSYTQMEEVVHRTLRWAKRSKIYWSSCSPLYDWEQYVFAIAQGGTYRELRYRCTIELVQMDFPGYAIGGVSVGEPMEEILTVLEWSTEWLPKEKPRYLMGVGNPIDILEGIERGIDLFDCVIPTRNARNGQIFTTRGKMNIRNAKYRGCKECIDPLLPYFVSQEFSLGYLHHLFKSREILGLQLATLQNLAFYQWLIEQAREKIQQNRFRQWKTDFIEQWGRNSV